MLDQRENVHNSSTSLLNCFHRYLVAKPWKTSVINIMALLDQEDVKRFMTNDKRIRRQVYFLQRLVLEQEKLECKCLAALVETFPGEGG